MGKMMTTALWNAIEAIPPSGGPRKQWQILTGTDWAAASTLLRATGMKADTIPCFNIRQGGCNRTIIRHSADNIRAVCGESEKLCASEKLTAADAEALAVDRAKLAAALASALSLDAAKTPQSDQKVMHLGMHHISAGLGFPVFLVLGGTSFLDAASTFVEVERIAGPKLVLAPTEQGLGATARTYLDKIGATMMYIDRLITLNDSGTLAPVAPPEQILSGLRASLEGGADQAAWRMPADAKWEDVTIQFVSNEKITVHHKGQHRSFEPSEINMMDGRTKRPDSQWALLKIIAQNGGRIPLPAPGKDRKPKESLSKKLIAAFGIPGDPIKAKHGEYVALYVTNAEGLKQGKQGAYQGNFADDD